MVPSSAFSDDGEPAPHSLPEHQPAAAALPIDEEDGLSPVIGPLQLAAAAVPARRITDLVGRIAQASSAPIAKPFQTSGGRKARR